jgi:hypothetical protein
LEIVSNKIFMPVIYTFGSKKDEVKNNCKIIHNEELGGGGDGGWNLLRVVSKVGSVVC